MDQCGEGGEQTLSVLFFRFTSSVFITLSAHAVSLFLGLNVIS